MHFHDLEIMSSNPGGSNLGCVVLLSLVVLISNIALDSNEMNNSNYIVENYSLGINKMSLTGQGVFASVNEDVFYKRILFHNTLKIDCVNKSK